MLPTLHLRPLYHRGQENIGLFFTFNKELSDTLRTIKGVRWSQTHKCWYLPLNETAYRQLINAVTPLTSIDNSPLKHYLHKRKQVTATSVASEKPQESAKQLPASTTAWRLSSENLKALDDFVQQLKLRAYSPSTIRTYRNELLQLLQLLKNKPVQELTP